MCCALRVRSYENSSGGTCNDGVMSYTCTCPLSHTGGACEINVDECGSSPCANSGTCHDGLASYVCACAAGWGGSHCETGLAAKLACLLYFFILVPNFIRLFYAILWF